jgi:integrase
MTVAKIFKRCDCRDWSCCPHPWVVRYRTTGGRSSRQREQSFGEDLREAEDFALKVEYDKRTRTFVDPKAGRVLFRDAAGTWLDQHLGADSSIATYRSVLRAHIDPAIGRCRINRGNTLRVKEQVNPAAQLKPLKFRQEREFRDIPLPPYVSEAIDKHVAGHGTTPDGYLFQGRKHKLVVRRSYQQDFQCAAARAGLPPEFIPHSLRHLYASTALAEGIPITEVSRWLGHNSIEVTHQIYGHLIPSSFKRARTALDEAYQQGRRSAGKAFP